MFFSLFPIRKPRQFEDHLCCCDPGRGAWERRRRKASGGPASAGDGEEERSPGPYARGIRFRHGIMAERQRNGRPKMPGMIRPGFLLAIVFLIVWYLFVH